ncbi:LON peptidase substrate-binding domain-containing protein [Luteimonas sp. MC1782]|nr:LON peptidase substrate-binding domain-containing protein [Luteimonas sp. MC1895]MBJ6984865.1 LON peptidase substrate-binding domain-containing protein [Luteimonas sp. MC1750]QQO05552.1 LON peptidase substrate-binding domain-containing protein [Luteimonas sp. MC1750]
MVRLSVMSETPMLPLFPLQAVLVPGAVMGLRVFEPRYLDMVGECGRSGRGFGICLITEGEEVGGPAVPSEYGTEAVIEDFGTDDDGLLTLRVRGARRFRVLRSAVRENGLVEAGVEWLGDAPATRLRPQHALLGTLLERIFDQVGRPPGAEGSVEDAVWVGWRLLEMLPMPEESRAAMLGVDDPHARLDGLLELIG